MSGFDEDPAAFADSLTAMTDDELFALMQKLDQESEAEAGGRENLEETLSRIAQVSQVIEERYPGQALAPYRQWQRSSGV